MWIGPCQKGKETRREQRMSGERRGAQGREEVGDREGGGGRRVPDNKGVNQGKEVEKTCYLKNMYVFIFILHEGRERD